MNRTAAIFTAIIAAAIIAIACFTYTEPAFDEPVSYGQHVAESECAEQAIHTEMATIVSVIDNNVTVKTEDGELFAFVGTDYNVGDNVKLLINTNDTNDNSEDDSIINAILL